MPFYGEDLRSDRRKVILWGQCGGAVGGSAPRRRGPVVVHVCHPRRSAVRDFAAWPAGSDAPSSRTTWNSASCNGLETRPKPRRPAARRRPAPGDHALRSAGLPVGAEAVRSSSAARVASPSRGGSCSNRSRARFPVAAGTPGPQPPRPLLRPVRRVARRGPGREDLRPLRPPGPAAPGARRRPGTERSRARHARAGPTSVAVASPRVRRQGSTS